jgi:hypothetical protein
MSYARRSNVKGNYMSGMLAFWRVQGYSSRTVSPISLVRASAAYLIWGINLFPEPYTKLANEGIMVSQDSGQSN